MKIGYEWEWEEISWAILVGGSTFLLEILVKFDFDTVTDWKTWGIGIGSGLIRAVAGAVLAVVTRPRQG